jgi:hypothetical protein
MQESLPHILSGSRVYAYEYEIKAMGCIFHIVLSDYMQE